MSSAPAIIEQSKRDAAGGVYTKRFLKGAILGKGGFAKCYRVTDMDTKEEWALQNHREEVTHEAAPQDEGDRPTVCKCQVLCARMLQRDLPALSLNPNPPPQPSKFDRGDACWGLKNCTA